MEAFKLMRLLKEQARINAKLFDQIKHNEAPDVKLDRRGNTIAREVLAALPGSRKEEFEVLLFTVRTDEEMKDLVRKIIPLL